MPSYLPFISVMLAGLLLMLATPSLSDAEPVKSTMPPPPPPRKVWFVPPGNDQKPERTVGAGTRNGENCSGTSPSRAGLIPSLTPLALVPPDQVGYTLAERPSFWIYVPQTSAQKVVLSLREDGIKAYSQSTFLLTNRPTLLELTPPQSSRPLEIGKTYLWAAVLVCGDRPSPNDPVITAWVRRIAPPGSSLRKTPLDQASWYGAQGIWYDALTTLAHLQQTTPQHPEMKTIWADFLRSGGLESIHPELLQDYAYSSFSPLSTP